MNAHSKPPSTQLHNVERDARRSKEPLPANLHKSREALEREGYCFGDLNSVLTEKQLLPFIDAAKTAPLDQYDKTASRYRRYHQGIYAPWCDRLMAVPPYQDDSSQAPYTTYFQSKNYNFEYGNQDRRFAPLTDEQLTCPALMTLVSTCYRMIPRWRMKGDNHRLVLVGMHVIKLYSDGRRAAVATPNHAHQDGEPFTFVILLERNNVEGGMSYIMTPDAAGQFPDDLPSAKILAQGILSAPLEMVAVDDARVSHHVSGVLGAKGRPGDRSVLILDFSELQPDRTPIVIK